MPAPASKCARVSPGLQPRGTNTKKAKTSRNSPGNTPGAGRTARPNPDATPPPVAPPNRKETSKKTHKTVNVKGNRGKGHSKSGAGCVTVGGDDKDQCDSGSGSGSGSSEEYDDVLELEGAPQAEVKIDELVRAAEERAANEPVRLCAGYELITNPASKPMAFDPLRRGHLRKNSLASSTGFTDESDWCELDMDGVEAPVPRAKYAEVLKRATTLSAVVGGARA